MHRHLLPVLFLSCATLTVGCASEDVTSDALPVLGESDVTLVDDAVTVDESFADDVEAAPDRLVIPSAGHEETLAAIKVGTVVAGDRAAKGSKNPYGFLRRVTAIESSGEDVVLSTKRAELSEWIKDGRIDFSSKRSLVGKRELTPGGVVTRALKLRANEGEAAGEGEGGADITASIDSAVKVSNASLTVKASFDGYFDMRTRGFGPVSVPTGAKYKSVLTLDPSVAADITLSVSSKTTIDEAFRGAEVTIPIAAPIPVTLSFKPELKCVITAGGSLTATVGTNAAAHLVVGFEGDAGFDHLDVSNLSETPTATASAALKSIDGKATASARCEIVAIPKLLLFDAVGIEGRVGPYEKLTGDLCSIANPGGATSGFTLREEHGLTYAFSGRIQTPIFDQGKSFDLLSQADLPTDGEQFLVGDAETCKAKTFDSCAGRANGFYCSEVAANAGIVCEDGVIKSGLQCAGSRTCAGGTPSAITCK